MRASVTVLPAMCTTPYWRRLTVPSGPTRYWPVTGWAPETRASCTLTVGSRSHWRSHLSKVVRISSMVMPATRTEP